MFSFTMGRLYFEHFGGSFLYNCAECDNFLSNIENMVTDHFQGPIGNAYLFLKVANVINCDNVTSIKTRYGECLARNVHCKKCEIKLGFVIEYMERKYQRNKEGKILIYSKMVKSSKGLPQDKCR